MLCNEEMSSAGDTVLGPARYTIDMTVHVVLSMKAVALQTNNYPFIPAALMIGHHFSISRF
jgi:hypothetical protein